MWRVRQAGFLPDAPFADGCGQTLAAAAAAGAAGAVAAGVEGLGREGDDAVEDREGLYRVGDGRGVDEMLLEAGFDGGLDLVDVADGLFDLGAAGGVEQGNARAGACGVPGGCHLVERGVGDHA